MDNPSAKTKAIVAYLTFIGLFIALSMNQDTKHAFATWHIRNMFGLLVLLFIAIALPMYHIGFYLYWVSAACWLFSLVMAIMGKQQAIPFFSEKFQSWFKFLG